LKSFICIAFGVVVVECMMHILSLYRTTHLVLKRRYRAFSTAPLLGQQSIISALPLSELLQKLIVAQNQILSSGVLCRVADMATPAPNGVQSPDPAIRKSAEEVLDEFSKHAGYCSALFSITRDREADRSCRIISVICLKNVVHRLWVTRRRGTFIVSDEGKYQLRSSLLTLLDEPEWSVAVQLSVLMSKVTRHDWPQNWPNFFPVLMQVYFHPHCTAYDAFIFVGFPTG
jgi:hypothetical protein